MYNVNKNVYDLTKDYEPFSEDDIKNIIFCMNLVPSSKTILTPKRITLLERNGFILSTGGDLTFNKLNEIFNKHKSVLECKQIDKEVWYIKKLNYILTKEELNKILQED